MFWLLYLLTLIITYGIVYIMLRLDGPSRTDMKKMEVEDLVSLMGVFIVSLVPIINVGLAIFLFYIMFKNNKIIDLVKDWKSYGKTN